MPEEASILIDSEDLNLFEMPMGWRGLVCYQKKVRGDILGLCLLQNSAHGMGVSGRWSRPLFPPGLQRGAPPIGNRAAQEKPIPQGTISCSTSTLLTNFEWWTRCRAVLEGTASKEHAQFEEACASMGLPRNQGKVLAGALGGSIQGGELRGHEGVFMLHPNKMRQHVSKKDVWNCGAAHLCRRLQTAVTVMPSRPSRSFSPLWATRRKDAQRCGLRWDLGNDGAAAAGLHEFKGPSEPPAARNRCLSN